MHVPNAETCTLSPLVLFALNFFRFSPLSLKSLPPDKSKSLKH